MKKTGSEIVATTIAAMLSGKRRKNGHTSDGGMLAGGLMVFRLRLASTASGEMVGI